VVSNSLPPALPTPRAGNEHLVDHDVGAKTMVFGAERSVEGPGLAELQLAVNAYQQHEEAKAESVRRQAEELAAARERHAEWKKLAEAIWNAHEEVLDGGIYRVNTVLKPVGISVILPESARWHHETQVNEDAGEIDEDEWFGIMCEVKVLGMDLVISVQEEYLAMWVDYMSQEEVWLQAIDEQAIADAVARLLLPLIEEKRKADDH
jgi:hypothetical protein